MSRWLMLFLMLRAAPLWAQFPTVNNETSQMKGTVRVMVIYPDGSHAGAHLRVQLRLALTTMLMAIDQTDASGTAEFSQLNAGEYNIRVSGAGVEPAESGEFPVEDGRDYQTIMITVKPAGGREPGAAVRASASVAVVDLNVPKKAAKEYKRAGHDMEDESWEKAIGHLNKAIAIYPQYSAAYNDLAVCYGYLKQKDKQRAALLKAISLNDHCVPALVNLGYLEMKDGQFADAAAALNKALTAEPSNADALSLMAQAELEQGHYDQAIADARKAHGLPHHFAMVHCTAASALDREKRIPEAIAELQLFLQEEPQGPRAEVVRKALAAMQNDQSEASDKSASAAGRPVASKR
jgi:tetratricopeptide (TPR) repeat protein